MSNWLKDRRSRNERKPCGPVGTEAAALEQVEHNKKHFCYPGGGFVVPIEYTLLYSMIKDGPETYPAQIVMETIREEDFREYMQANTRTKKETDDDAIASYAQLSAILALSSVRWPPEGDDEHDNVGQVLCKALSKCVIRHAEQNDLDRASEVRELLHPVQVYSTRRENRAALKQIVPLYIGYAALLVTGNPLPVLVGMSVTMNVSDKMVKERDNLDAIKAETNRRADVEKASLLDEEEDVMYDSV